MWIGTLNPDIPSESYLDNDSDVEEEEEDVSLNVSSVPTPSRSPYCSSRSLSGSPACTPGSITRELTQVSDSEPDEKTTPIVQIKKRKRLISDRGECELQFPVCDYRTSHYNWSSCGFLNNSRLCAVGLYNPSNYCFLNAVLQSVVHTAQLARYIVEHHNPKECELRQPCLHCKLKQHIIRVTNTQKPTDASWMRPFFAKIFPSHRRDHQEDAHEMLTLLLSALEPPLLPKRISAETSNGGGDATRPKNSAYATPSTAIEQIFGGSLRNKITCDECSTPYVNYEKIREMNVGLLPRYQGREVRLSQLMNDFFNEERIQGFICKSCNSKRTAIRSTSILRSPSVLIVQLKRFNIFGGKNRLVVRPDPVLHLDKFMYNKQAERYRLNGVIQHLGGGLNYGHYVGAFRGFDERSWFHFDDSEVSASTDDKVQNMEPYILFYTKIRDQTPLSVEKPLNGCRIYGPLPQEKSNGLANDNNKAFFNNGSESTSEGFINGNKLMNENRKSSPNGSLSSSNGSSNSPNGNGTKPTGFINAIHQNGNGLSRANSMNGLHQNGNGLSKANSLNGIHQNGNGFSKANSMNGNHQNGNGEVKRSSNDFKNFKNSHFPYGKGNGSFQKNNEYRNQNGFSNNKKFNNNGNGFNHNKNYNGFKNGKRSSSDFFHAPNGFFAKRQHLSMGNEGASPQSSNGFKSMVSSPKPSAPQQQNTNSNKNGTSNGAQKSAEYKSFAPVSFKIAKKDPIRPLDLH